MMAPFEGSPDDPDTARAQLEATRARMSTTIDEIEATLLQKKEEIRNRLDVRARIREKPMHAAGIVVGAGFLIGFLTGGGDEEDPELEIVDRRSAIWESRARRLLRIAREQEDEIDRLGSALTEADHLLLAAEEAGRYDEDGYGVWGEDDDSPDVYTPRLAALRGGVADRLRATLADLSRAVVMGVREKL